MSEDSLPKQLVWRKRVVPALEIRIDELPDEYRGNWQTSIRNFLAHWVNKNAFSQRATLWHWGSMSANYVPNAEFGWSEFIIEFGLPGNALESLEKYLSTIFGGRVRISGEVEARRDAGWAPFCHIEETGIWRPEDAYTWRLI